MLHRVVANMKVSFYFGYLLHYISLVKGTVKSTNRCNIVERVLDTDCNEPILSSSENENLPKEMIQRVNVIHLTDK